MADKTVSQLIDEMRQNPSAFVPRHEATDDVRLDAEIFRSRFFGVPMDEGYSVKLVADIPSAKAAPAALKNFNRPWFEIVSKRNPTRSFIEVEKGKIVSSSLPDPHMNVARQLLGKSPSKITPEQWEMFVYPLEVRVKVGESEEMDETNGNELGQVAKELADVVGTKLDSAIKKARGAILNHTELSRGGQSATYRKMMELTDDSHKKGSVKYLFYDLVSGLLELQTVLNKANESVDKDG